VHHKNLVVLCDVLVLSPIVKVLFIPWILVATRFIYCHVCFLLWWWKFIFMEICYFNILFGAHYVQYVILFFLNPQNWLFLFLNYFNPKTPQKMVFCNVNDLKIKSKCKHPSGSSRILIGPIHISSHLYRNMLSMLHNMVHVTLHFHVWTRWCVM